MKIIVTGGAGFIGSHIVDRYITLGHEVAVVDNLTTGQRKYVNPKAVFYEADVRDKKVMGEIFASFRPIVLNHHAAQMDVRKSVADPGYDAGVNIIGLITLMEAGRQTGLKRVLFASSGGAVYGDAETMPTPETYPTRPASPYGVSKLSSEYYLQFYQQAYGISFAALRYGNVYGPRQNPHGEAGVVAIFTKKLLAGEQPIINGDGEQSRDFVYVGDIVSANEKAVTYEQSLIVNIGTGVATTVNTIFDTLCTLTKSSAPRQYGPAKPGEQRASLLDTTKVEHLLGWKATVTLSDGLSQTANFFTHEG